MKRLKRNLGRHLTASVILGVTFQLAAVVCSFPSNGQWRHSGRCTSQWGLTVPGNLNTFCGLVDDEIPQHRLSRRDNDASSSFSKDDGRNDDRISRLSTTAPELSRSGFLTLSAASILAAIASPAESFAEPTARSKTSSVDDTKYKTHYQFTSNSELLGSAKDTKIQAGSTLEETISGFVAGASLTVTKTLVKYPLDTATVRLQMPGTAYSIFDPTTLFEGSFRGILAPLLSNIPAGAVFFAVKDATKSALKESGLPKWLSTSIAVAAAQPPYWLVRNPSEVVKTRQQAGIEGYGEGVSALDAVKLAISKRRDGVEDVAGGGVLGLYSGYLENILYAFPADVIKFVCYEGLSKGKKNLPPVEGAVYGAISTGVAQLLTTPLDVVRNRVMAGERGPQTEESACNRDTKLSYIDSLVKLAREEGLKGLFAGTSPRVGKAILSGAIQFATYEETKQQIASFFERR